MGTQWKLDGDDLTVTKLAKPYVAGSVVLPPVLGITITPTKDGKGLVADLSAYGPDDPNPVLFALHKAGYLNHTQKVTVAQVDEWAALVTFEDQVPLGITSNQLQRAVPGAVVVVAHKTLTIGSTRNARQDVDEAIRWLWNTLRKFEVVKGNPPKFWR